MLHLEISGFVFGSLEIEKKPRDENTGDAENMKGGIRLDRSQFEARRWLTQG